jgi:hypothetical protein
MRPLLLAYAKMRVARARRGASSVTELVPVREIRVFAALWGNDLHQPGLGDMIFRSGISKMLAEKYPNARISLIAGSKLLRKFPRPFFEPSVSARAH